MSSGLRLHNRHKRRAAQKSRGTSVAWQIAAQLIAGERGCAPSVVTAEFHARKAIVMAFAIKHHVSLRVSHFIHNAAERRHEDPNTWERYQIDSCVNYLKGVK